MLLPAVTGASEAGAQASVQHAAMNAVSLVILWNVGLKLLLDDMFEWLAGDEILGAGTAIAKTQAAAMQSVTNTVRLSILLLIVSACSLPTSSEMNLAFRIDRNQLVMSSVLINGEPGRYVLGSAAQRSVISAPFATARGIDGSEGVNVRLRPDVMTRVRPGLADLGSEIDAVLGRDLLGPVVVIDYRNQLVSRLSHLPELEVEPHRWRTAPQFPVTLAGRTRPALIDTSIPDSLIVPRAMVPGTRCTRCVFDVEVAGLDFDQLDVRVIDDGPMRIGNRVLEHFLVVIDYRRGRAALIR